MRRWSLLVLLHGLACDAEAPPADLPDAGEWVDAGPGDGGAFDGGAGIDGGSLVADQGRSLFGRLAGLWSGPATQTRLGNFPLMNVDFRPVDGQVLFGRVDLDESNALRFAFSIETHQGREQLIYRNGGYFLGLLRDDRTQLLDVDLSEERYHFCHLTRGCDYTDVVFDFDGPERLHFRVLVRGQVHVDWQATRLEERPLAPGFEEGLVSQGDGDAPIPTLPTLEVTTRWTAPLATPAPVWLIVSASGCSLSGCVQARQLRAMASAGATQVNLRLREIHAAPYEVLVVLDRNGDLALTQSPGSGDGLSFPQAITVAATGTTAVNAAIAFDLP